MKGLTRWQWITLVSLTVGYAGYYFCRSNLSVATPLILDEFADEGVTRQSMGQVASTALLFYIAGKLLNGIATDFVGGRRMFLMGMVGSVMATILFGLGSGVLFFTVAWCANRFVQSMGWGALVKTAAAWFPPENMGTLTSILCLSYLFGDALAKFVLGMLINFGLGWRTMFFAAAAILAAMALIGVYTLRSKPEDVGEASPPPRPDNLFGEEGDKHRPGSLISLLKPFLKSPAFWLIAIMNFGLTLQRETFTFWTPTYLNEVIQMSEGNAGMSSSLYSLFGGLSVLAAGAMSDYVSRGRRGGVMVAFLIPASIAVFVLSTLDKNSPQLLALALIASAGFLSLGPYAFLTGVIAVDLGGKRGSATAAGSLDAIGYAGAYLSGERVGWLVDEYGWQTAFSALGVVLVITSVVGVIYWLGHERRLPAIESLPSEDGG